MARASGRFGDWKNIHRRLRRWRESGVIEQIFRHLAADRDGEYMMIDATIARAHQHGAGARKRGVDQASDNHAEGWRPKTPAIVDAPGNPVAIAITPVIPPKSNRIMPRSTDFALYRERNLIERFLNKLK